MSRKPFSNLKRPELLAPAGDLERCKTAILYGADAVYIGGRQYSLRSRASNFTLEDIKEACTFAKQHGSRIHVTVNMVPHDKDLEGLKDYLITLQELGVHAIIAASPYVLKTAREYAPKLERHCSTQMSVTNSYGAKFLYDHFGIDRVVLGRECSMEEVRTITASIPIETEAFIHGGMCVNYSGRCTLSNRMTLRDANRGGCAQSCRWSYRLYDHDREISPEEQLFTMGSKDLFALSMIYPLMEAGVSSFKIEGRMKTEFYVASVVKGYRRVIDEILATGHDLITERYQEHRNEILKALNRSTWEGFYTGERGKNSIIYREQSNDLVNHGFLGRIVSCNTEDKTAVIEVRNVFKVGDVLEVLSPYSDIHAFPVFWIRSEEGDMVEAAVHPMEKVTIPVEGTVVQGDIIRRGL